MIIAQISDSHIDPKSDKLEDRLNNLLCVVDNINNLNPSPDLVIHTGDVVHNGSQEKYNLALTILEGITVPMYVCAGNRDDRSLIVKNFQMGLLINPDLEFLQYSINNYPVRLIALDTLSTSTNMGDYCQVRANHLSWMLAQEPQKPTALFMHHPPFEVIDSKYPFQFEHWNTVDYLSHVLEQNSQVKHLFCGHTHRNSHGQILGIPASTVPSVAVDLRFGSVPDGAELKPIYHLHRFDGQHFQSETVVC